MRTGTAAALIVIRTALVAGWAGTAAAALPSFNDLLAHIQFNVPDQQFPIATPGKFIHNGKIDTSLTKVRGLICPNLATFLCPPPTLFAGMLADPIRVGPRR